MPVPAAPDPLIRAPLPASGLAWRGAPNTHSGEAAPGLEPAFRAADSLCQTLSGWPADGYQVPAASEVDRGKVLGEKVAPAGTIHGKAMMRYLPAWTAGSRSLSARASSTPAERMDRPRNGEVRSSSGP